MKMIQIPTNNINIKHVCFTVFGSFYYLEINSY